MANDTYSMPSPIPGMSFVYDKASDDPVGVTTPDGKEVKFGGPGATTPAAVVSAVGQMSAVEAGAAASKLLSASVPGPVSNALASALQSALGTGRFNPGIGNSYWAHPQNAVFLPGGDYYPDDVVVIAETAGKPFPNLCILAMPGTVTIRIPDGKYAFDVTGRLTSMLLFGLTFVGGAGALRQSYSGTNVAGILMVSHCDFDNYTECAISSDAADNPYWRILNSSFMGALSGGTIGVAIGGLLDGTIIQGNRFLRNKYHIKAGPLNSGDFHVKENDLLSWTANTTEADIWIVPNDIAGLYGSNSGQASEIVGNKFGNENTSPGKPRILIAKEGAGTSRANRHHSTAWESSSGGAHYIRGLKIDGNRFSTINQGGLDGPGAPLIRSYCEQVGNVQFGESNVFDGGRWDYLVEWMGARRGDYSNLTWEIKLGLMSDSVGYGAPFRLGVSNRPTGLVSGLAGSSAFGIKPVSHGGEKTLGLVQSTAAWVAFGSATKSAGNAPDGTATAAEITVASDAIAAYFNLSNTDTVHGKQCWLVMSVSKSASLPIQQVLVSIKSWSSNEMAVQKKILLPDSWGDGPLCIPFIFPDAVSDTGWQLTVASIGYAAGTANKFVLGHARVHSGSAPLSA